MAIASFSFAGLVLVGVLLFHASRSSVWRRGVLLGLSAAFLASFGQSPVSLWPVPVFAVVTALAIIFVAHKPGRRRAIAIAVPVILFLLFKGYFPWSLSSAPLITVGISYVMFRAIQVISDLDDEALDGADIDPLELVLFLFSFLTLVAGPIQRFQDFSEQLRHAEKFRISDCDFSGIAARAAGGLFKLVVLAPLVHEVYSATPGIDGPALRLGLGASVFMFWIYLNFSAYMDLVISVGRMFGFTLPENFNRPDRSINFLDIWNRWHITLSRTFLTYVFNPLVRLLLNVFPGQVAFAGVAAYLCVFFLIGWWHGPGSHFLLSGLLFGIAAATTKAWQIARLRFLWPDYKLPGGSILSGGLGLGTCAVALVPTWPLFTTATEVTAAFGSPAVFAQVLLVAWLAGILIRLAGLAFDRIVSFDIVKSSGFRVVQHPAAVGMVLVIIFAAQVSSNSQFSPIVYYQRF